MTKTAEIMNSDIYSKLSRPVGKFPLNEAGRDIFVGDIHGFFSLFEEGLAKLEFDPNKDRVFSVGDLIDRGPDSLACLRLTQHKWFHAVLGNHEFMLWQQLQNDDARKSLENRWQFELSHDEISECREMLSQMPLALTVQTDQGSVGVVHAYVPEYTAWGEFCKTLEDGNPEIIELAIWSRGLVRRPRRSTVTGVDFVVIGHQSLQNPTHYGNIICIDTCVQLLKRYCQTCGLTFMSIKNGQPEFTTISQS